jgi:hypothetical protein
MIRGHNKDKTRARRCIAGRRQALGLVLIVLSTASVHVVAQDEDIRQIRTSDRWLRSVLGDGLRASPTFRALVDRIERSDIIVYLKCDPDPPSGIEGRLSFVSAAAGYRYLLVRLRRRASNDQQLAIMAHELWHAIEIADTPTIIDPESMAREYRILGYQNTRSTAPGVSFDTDAAIRAGNQVHREVVATAAAD